MRNLQDIVSATAPTASCQAQARHRLLHKNGHRIAYVIDGAGNFERRSALSTICRYSDCTVSFRDDEIERLATFLESVA